MMNHYFDGATLTKERMCVKDSISILDYSGFPSVRDFPVKAHTDNMDQRNGFSVGIRRLIEEQIEAFKFYFSMPAQQVQLLKFKK